MISMIFFFTLLIAKFNCQLILSKGADVVVDEVIHDEDPILDGVESRAANGSETSAPDEARNESKDKEEPKTAKWVSILILVLVLIGIVLAIMGCCYCCFYGCCCCQGRPVERREALTETPTGTSTGTPTPPPAPTSKKTYPSFDKLNRV